MLEQTKHERFISKETLEQIANLIEPLSNCLGAPIALFDANCNALYGSVNPPLCSSIAEDGGAEKSMCRECHKQLRNRLKDIYDVPIMEKCSANVEVIAIPVKVERQFIGMLCLNPPSWTGDSAKVQTHWDRITDMIAFLEALLRQTATRSQDLGELVSQLLAFQNELTMSYRFSNAASDSMDINLLFQEALEVIQAHVRPRAACIAIPSELEGLKAIVHSGGNPLSILGVASYSAIYNEILGKALQGIPVVVNSCNGHPESRESGTYVKSVLSMPIRVGKDVFGAIILVNKRDGEMFLADDENFVTSLTNSLGMVLKHIRLAQEVVKSEKALVEKQREIVARVVHKMRNLFVAMKGNINWVHEVTEESETDQENLESALAGIDRNFRDASKVISGFLRYVAPERFQPEYTDIPDLISEIVRDMNKALNGHVQIKEEHIQGLPQVRIDVGLFRSIIEELIVNASQNVNGDGQILLRTGFASDEYMRSAGVPSNGKKYIAIEVSDNGPGVPADIKRKIFDLGFSTRSMGTGLGLSLVKRDIEQHRGSIVEVGEAGANFLIVLPVAA